MGDWFYGVAVVRDCSWQPRWVVALPVLVGVLLAGCGGGDGGGGNVSADHQPVFPNSRVASTQLSRINADSAYQGNHTGEGQVVTVIDSGFRSAHQELAGKTEGNYTDDSRSFSRSARGTEVASIIAGSRGDGNMHGVAYGAKLDYIQVPPSVPNVAYSRFELTQENVGSTITPRQQSLSDLIQCSRQNQCSGFRDTGRQGDTGIRIINFGLYNSDIPDAIGSYTTGDITTHMQNTANILAQTHRYVSETLQALTDPPAAADKSILVWAAGNSGRIPNPDNNAEKINHATPILYAGLPLHFPDLQAHSLAVVAVDNDGVIADYANRCGENASGFCIAAPGDVVAATSASNESYARVQGSEFAAATVSGALAVLRQRFPMLGSHDLVTRIKDTANKTGIYADSAIYGVGLLDLGAAVNDPVGEMQMSGISLNANSFTPGFSFGDALQTAFSGQLVTGFDQLLTPFEYNLGGFVKTASRSSLNPLRAFHQDWHRQLGAKNGVSNGFGAAGFALDSASEGSSYRISANPNSHLTLAQGGVNFALKSRNGIAFSLFNTAKKDGTPTAAGLSFAWQKTANFGVGGGILRENEMALQSRGEGVFGGLNANTFFFGIAAKKQFRNWQFHAGAEAGAVFVDGDYWLDDVSTLLTSSLSADAVKKLNDRNTLRLGISSPLRVEHGDANLTIPAGRTRYRELLHRKITPSLVPTGRQIDLTATWSRKLAFPNARVYASLRNSYQPGHRQNADSEVSALLSLELDF